MDYYYISSGEICNNMNLEKSFMTVSEGGIVNSTTVFQNGAIAVQSSGVANSTTVYFGSITVSSGGTANSVTVYFGGITFLSGGTANVVTVNSFGRVFVNGTANSVTVNPGGMLNIGSGATVKEIRENGGFISVADDAEVTFVPNVFSNCMQQEGSNPITLHSGTTAVNLTFNDLTIYDGGVAENASAVLGKMQLSGGTANGTVLSGGILNIFSGGVANGTELNYSRAVSQAYPIPLNCSMTVFSGGTANHTVVRGYRNDRPDFIASGGIMRLDGGIANNTSVCCGGILDISNGGVADDTIVGGYAAWQGPETEIDSGTVNVLEGGTANNVTVNIGGMLFISGGRAVGIVENGGYVDIRTADAATFASNTFSGLILYSTPFNSEGLSATVHSGTTAVDVTMEEGARLEVFSGGKLTGRLVNLGGTVSVNNGAIIDFDLTRTAPGAAALLYDLGGIAGTPSFTVTVGANQAEGVYTLADGASEFHETITVVNTSGEMLKTMTVGETAIISDVEYMLILSDSTLSMKVGDAIVPSPYTSDGLILSGGTVSLGKNEIYHDTLICSGGSLTVSNGGTADGVTVNSGGSMIVTPNGSAVNIVENGGYVEFTDKAEVSFVPNTFSNCYLENATVHSGTTACDVKVAGSLFVFEGGIADGVEAWTPYRDPVNSLTVIVSGGTANNVTLTNAKSIMNVSSGGVANNASLTVGWVNEEGGQINIYSGASANGTFVGNSGSMTIETGGTATDTTIVGGSVQIRGAADRIAVSSGGTLNVATVASATNIIENGGYVKATPGKKVTFASNSFSGLVLDRSKAIATVHSGTTAFDTTISAGSMLIYDGGITERTYVKAGGRMNVSSGGTAKDTVVSAGGSMIVTQNGTADGTIIDSRGSLRISGSATANNTIVSAGGQLMVDNGTVNGLCIIDRGTVSLNNCKLTGRIWLGITSALPIINVNEGTILDFDLTQTSAGAGALVNALSGFSGVTLYTLTVEENWEPGSYDYYLALGAGEFDSTITVMNKKGDELGVLTIGETVGIGDCDYTLKLETNEFKTTFLTVTVDVASGGSPIPDWTFYTGDFDGDGCDMLSVQSGEAITVYANGEPWGIGLVLEDGWEIAGVGDFSGDGLDDFLRVNDEGYVVGEMSNGNGTFSPQVLNFLNEGWDILGTGDFNGNGVDDVLIANPTAASETVGLLGYWESGVTWTLINGYSPEWECVATGDYNGDGKCDMLWKNSFVGDGGLTYNAYCTWIVDNPVDWRMVSVANPDEWNFLCSGDFNGDKMNDIAMINNVGVVGIWGVNDGYLNSWSILSAVTPEWQLAGVADFNADGTDDIAWSNTDTGLTGYWQINNKELTAWANIAVIS